MKEVLLKTFNSEMLAEAMQNLLKSFGIKSFIQSEGALAFRGGLGDGGYVVNLYVSEKDYKEAMEIIKDK